MAKSPEHFPPVGHEERYDAIISKGRKIRHRRQAVFGAATSSVLAACVALVVIFGTNGGSAKSSGQVFANEGKNAKENPVEPTVAPGQMQLNVTRDGDTFDIELSDPLMAVPTEGQSLGDSSYRAQQCVLVTLEDGGGQTVAEGFGCKQYDPSAATSAGRTSEPPGSGVDSGAVEVQLNPRDQLSIGCAAVAERRDPVTTEPHAMTSTFRADLPATVISGEYTMTVEAVSGFGDGCPDNPEPAAGASGTNQIEKAIAVQKQVSVSH
ncbi:MAG: hypothetical protein WBF71_01940 [Microthrixaceae bacterium]